MRRQKLLLGLSLLLPALASWPATETQDPPQPRTEAAGKPVPNLIRLTDILQQNERDRGIRFYLAAELNKDQVDVHNALDELPNLLVGYNWAGTYDLQGRLVSVSVTGRNGDGQSVTATKPVLQPLFAYRKTPGKVPKRYREYPSGSVFPIDLPVKQLRDMSLGDRLTLQLPDGEHDLLHDSAWNHRNGDKTWVARADEEANALYRTQITLGDGNFIDGQIRTSQGLYLLESDDSGQWLIDVTATGFVRGAFENGQSLPPPLYVAPVSSAPASDHEAVSAAGANGFAPPSSGRGEPSQVDVMLLYTDGLAADGINTRLNGLIAMANQALSDSRALVRLNLVATESTAYPDEGSNRLALEQLTRHQGMLTDAERLRKKHHADLVLLVRKFMPESQEHSCGEAWVNGSQGSPLSPALAYGVVNDGRADGYYCSSYTLAHEIGHLLGASHDRGHANVPGRYSFSYGYGVEGVFGDIMSYLNPEIGLFANPKLQQQCRGLICGVAIGQANQADVVSTFNQTATIVASFMQKDANE